MDTHDNRKPTGCRCDRDGRTLIEDVPGYLAECEHRQQEGNEPFQPRTFPQWEAAYQRGVISNKPAVGELGRERFDRLDRRMNPQPLDELQQERLLFTIDEDDRFRRALLRLLGGRIT